MSRTAALAVLLCSVGAFAQVPVPIQSDQVNPDNTVTFRYTAPSATKVSLSIDAYPNLLPMAKDAAGVWSVTTPVLPPEFYQYRFIEDGMGRLDPLNPSTVPNLVNSGNNLLVPGQPAAPWELAKVPHGRVDRHLYTTQIGKNLAENQEPYVVYTPPGYDAKRKGGYPVLYLLHGYSDSEVAWTQGGHADNILDKLLAAGKIVPMIVVMPQGYGDFDFIAHGWASWSDPAKISMNIELYGEMLLNEIGPAVEHEYNTAPGRNNRAIVGLSMGGIESLIIGLNHTDKFAWVGGMSAAFFNVKDTTYENAIPKLDAHKANLRLLWVACGTTDGLIAGNRGFIAWTKTKGFQPVAVETSGAHTWLTWRDNLVTLTPLLFR